MATRSAPLCLKSPRLDTAMVLRAEPTPLAAERTPRPAAPTWSTSRAMTGIITKWEKPKASMMRLRSSRRRMSPSLQEYLIPWLTDLQNGSRSLAVLKLPLTNHSKPTPTREHPPAKR